MPHLDHYLVVVVAFQFLCEDPERKYKENDAQDGPQVVHNSLHIH